MRPIHQHEIDHVTRADLADRLIAYTALAFFLTLAWLLPALGVWGILLPWAAGGPAPDPVFAGSLAYAAAFVGWMSWVGVAAVAAVSPVGGRDPVRAPRGGEEETVNPPTW